MKDFNFTIEHFSDNPDGSANFTARFSEEVAEILIQRGVEAILKEYIAQEAARPKSAEEKEAKRAAKKV